MPTGRSRGAVAGRLPIPVTSSWSSHLPHGYAAIGISRAPPRGQRGYRMYRALAPGDWFRAADEKTFVERYMAQLANLDTDQVLHDLARLADGNIPALLCFERSPPDTARCHRGLVAGWLKDTANLDIFELGAEQAGSGWSHPKLPAGMSLRP
jgi:hypothetical protein